MRPLIVLAMLATVPTLVMAAPICALPTPKLTPVAAQPTEAALVNQSSSTATSTNAVATPAPLPNALRAMPFVRHVASAGAIVTELGEAHGMHSIAARNGDQFMIFQVTTDGQAGVSGAMTDLTSAQLRTIADGNVTDLGVQHDLQGLFVRSGAQFQVFYATPDRERLIPGVMWDADGKDMTRQQVANVPGVIPTVVVGDTASRNPGATAAALPVLQKAAFGTTGPVAAPHLWMLIDPQCIYSVRAYQMLQPYVASGRLQLSIIPLSVLDYEDKGQSTKSALALLSKPADQMVSSWQAGRVGDAPSSEASDKLRANMAIAQAIGLKGTPTLVWRKSDGTEGRIDGMPTSVEALIASMRS